MEYEKMSLEQLGQVDEQLSKEHDHIEQEQLKLQALIEKKRLVSQVGKKIDGMTEAQKAVLAEVMRAKGIPLS